jgi:hypothetical protein
MALSRKNDFVRKQRSFERHFVFALQPPATAAILTAIWQYVFWAHEIHFPKSDEMVLIGAVIGVIGIAFSVVAGVVLTMTLDKYRKISMSVMQRDKETFLMYRDERLPIIMYILLGTLSACLIALMMLIEYSDVRWGDFAVFVVTCAISTYFFVARELENPAKSPWFAERIPPNWLEEDVDAHFRLGPITNGPQ